MLRRDFSLVEVVIATGMLAVFLLGLTSALQLGQQSATLAREQQAALEAANRQLDLITSAGDVDQILRVAGTGGGGAKDVGEYAFAVPYGEGALSPASAAYLPLNPDAAGTAGDESQLPGHVRVIEDVDGDGVIGGDEDLDGDGSVDYLEVRVVVAWRSAALGGADQSLELVSRVVR